MRYFLILPVMVTFFSVFQINSQEINFSRINPQKITISIDKSVSIQLPPDIEMDGLRINYFITGAFGGYGSFIAIKPEVRNYEIPILHDGKPVKTLKLIVFSPHYLVRTFDFPSLDGQNQNIELKLESAATVPFFGKVSLPTRLDTDELKVKVSYTTDWECEYFGLSDCILAPMPISSVNLEKDGKFKVNLPDFASDPIISSYKHKGNFYFAVEDKNGKLKFRLSPEIEVKRFDGIKAKSNYPTEQTFVSNFK